MSVDQATADARRGRLRGQRRRRGRLRGGRRHRRGAEPRCRSCQRRHGRHDQPEQRSGHRRARRQRQAARRGDQRSAQRGLRQCPAGHLHRGRRGTDRRQGDRDRPRQPAPSSTATRRSRWTTAATKLHVVHRPVRQDRPHRSRSGGGGRRERRDLGHRDRAVPVHRPRARRARSCPPAPRRCGCCTSPMRTWHRGSTASSAGSRRSPDLATRPRRQHRRQPRARRRPARHCAPRSPRCAASRVCSCTARTTTPHRRRAIRCATSPVRRSVEVASEPLDTEALDRLSDATSSAGST